MREKHEGTENKVILKYFFTGKYLVFYNYTNSCPYRHTQTHTGSLEDAWLGVGNATLTSDKHERAHGLHGNRDMGRFEKGKET